jgi:hypothetical protein
LRAVTEKAIGMCEMEYISQYHSVLGDRMTSIECVLLIERFTMEKQNSTVMTLQDGG